MSEIGVRALKQNASAVVAEAASGDVFTVTDRGRPVAQLGPLRASRLAMLLESGRARPSRRAIAELPEPERRRPQDRTLSEILREQRDSERA